MTLKTIAAFVVATLISISSFAQTSTAIAEDFKPSELNQPGQEYPQVKP